MMEPSKLKTDSNGSCFERLPNEMIFYIFEYLTHKEKKKARLVCNLWRSILDDPRRYGTFLYRLIVTNASIEYFFDSCRQMDEAAFRGITKRMPRMTSMNHRFPTIKHCILEWKNSQGLILRFLRYGTENLETLTITRFALENASKKMIAQALSQVAWKDLREFRLIITLPRYKADRAKKHITAVANFLRLVKMENVSKFQLSLQHQYDLQDREGNLHKLFCQFYVFLENHSSTLKILNVGLDSCGKRGFATPPFPESIVSKMKIQNCKLGIWGGSKLDSLVLPCLIHSELKEFELVISRTDTRNLQKVLDTNGDSLESISLHSAHVNLYWLKNCTALNSLEISTSQFYADPIDIDVFIFKNLRILNVTVWCSTTTNYDTLFQFIQQNGGSIEYLRLQLIFSHQQQAQIPGDIISVSDATRGSWLRHCSALKLLEIDSTSKFELPVIRLNVVFQNLVCFSICLYKFEGDPLDFAEWVVRALPKIETLRIHDQRTIPLEMIKILLIRTNVKKLRFSALHPTVWFYYNLRRIPGLKCGLITLGSIQPRVLYNLTSIDVDRTVFDRRSI